LCNGSRILVIWTVFVAMVVITSRYEKSILHIEVDGYHTCYISEKTLTTLEQKMNEKCTTK
jgi:hypothetical protein